MRFFPFLAGLGLLVLAAPTARCQHGGRVPPEVTTRLEALPASHIPLRNATLASAIRLLAADAQLSYLAPSESEFGERISSDVTMNPYDLLQLLGQDYSFGIDYDRGLWRFYRIDANALVTKAYSLRFNNLTQVSISSSSLNSQLAAASGGGGGGGGGMMGGSGGGVPHPSGGGGSGFSAKTSRIIEDVKKILALPSPGVVARKGSEAAKFDPIWDPDSSQLFVIATPGQHALIASYLKTVDRPQKLVRISVKFVETQRNPSQTLGVDWAQTFLGSGGPITLGGTALSTSTTTTTTSSNLPGGSNGTTVATTATSSTGGAGASTGAAAIQRLVSLGHGLPVSLLSAPAMQWTVQAIASDTRSSVVEDPVIFTANNHEVTFKATTEEPIQQGSTTFGSATAATSTQIAYLEVGTTLNVLPSLLPGDSRGKGIVVCNFAISVSSIIGTQSIGGNPYPVTSDRSYSYSVPIPNGQTLCIAGLEDRSRMMTSSKVPFFGDIPVLGYVFNNKQDSITHTTLIAFITPEIVDEPGPADAPVLALPHLRHRPFAGSSSETMHDVERSLDGLPQDIAALQACATAANKEAVLNQLDHIGIELSLIDVRLGEIKLERDHPASMQSRLVDSDRDMLTRAHEAVAKIVAN